MCVCRYVQEYICTTWYVRMYVCTAYRAEHGVVGILVFFSLPRMCVPGLKYVILMGILIYTTLA